ncbi:MAG: phospho-N-acetylmuramoyl-pentapeptide-transferase, partial [Lachnospiraceae bacterium]|nr:phospho-N-acetylmuramoyl-pentapeptide-transferase [Lachnospiraceae bacterium]
VFILDGGLGIIKVSLLRFLKISIMKNIRTPLHDHFRQNKDWSDTQTVFRFTVVQAFLILILIAVLTMA